MPPVEKEREFKYELPEDLQNADNKDAIETFVKGTLEQHSTFISEGFNGYISPDQLAEEADKLLKSRETKAKATETKTKEFNASVKAYILSKGAPETNAKIIQDASRVDFDENQSDEEWKAKIDNYLKTTPELVKGTIAGVSKNIVITPETKKDKPKKKKRFFMSND